MLRTSTKSRSNCVVVVVSCVVTLRKNVRAGAEPAGIAIASNSLPVELLVLPRIV